MKKIVFAIILMTFFVFSALAVFADNGFVISVNSVEISDNSCSAFVKICNSTDTPFSGDVVIALYDSENKLVGMDRTAEEIAAGADLELKKEISVNGSAEYIKVFLWNNMDSLKPNNNGYNDKMYSSFLESIEIIPIYVDYVVSGTKNVAIAEPVMRVRFKGTMPDKDVIKEISMKVLDSNDNIVFFDQVSCVEKEFYSSFFKATETGSYKLVLAGETPGEREEFIFHIETLMS